jgi:hypothetical protein
MSESENKVSLTLHADAVAAPALEAARMSSEVIAVCLPSLDASDLNELAPHDGLFTISFEPKHADLDAARDRYKSWLLGQAFHNLARGVRETLERAYLYTTIYRLAPKTWGEFVKQYPDIQKKANRMNFPDLLESVDTQLSAGLTFAQEFRSMQKVRNCLEHRGGKVEPIDCDEGTESLTLKLPRLKLFSVQSDGQETEIYIGQYFEKDTTIFIRRDVRVREYKMEEKIAFSSADFSEIAYACTLFANDVKAKLPQVTITDG